jgi:hypothetical protein
VCTVGCLCKGSVYSRLFKLTNAFPVEVGCIEFFESLSTECVCVWGGGGVYATVDLLES